MLRFGNESDDPKPLSMGLEGLMPASATRSMFVVLALMLCPIVFVSPCVAQSLIPSSISTPSNPLNLPSAYGGAQGSDTIPLTSGMLGAYMPSIPNLELGFQYYFGNKVRSGQASADYLFPVNLGNDAVLFGEAHGNYWNFAQKPAGGASNRVDLSFGGGYRKIMSNQLLVGINGFYDTSRLFNNWYSSGSFGLEMAANVGSTDAVDLNANWYGDIFSSNSILNAFRNKGGSYDIEAGYSHALFNQAMDLRLKFAGYQFDVGNSVYGYKTGADLTTRDGMFTLRYEYGNDRINGSWNNVGAFVNVGFQPENIVKGESPFTAPEPIFKSPRNLRRMLTQKVKRDWNQSYAPGRAALASAAVNWVCPSTEGTTYALTDAGRGDLPFNDYWTFLTTPDVQEIDTTKRPSFTICWVGLKNDITLINLTLISKNTTGPDVKYTNFYGINVFMNSGSGYYSGTFIDAGTNSDPALIANRLYMATFNPSGPDPDFSGCVLTITVTDQ